MSAAKRRDGHQCRYPACEYKPLDLPIDACHSKHRGMGGNPSGDRTKRELLISFCRVHHGEWDDHKWDVEPQTPQLLDGPVDFTALNPETGKWEVFASETVIGVSVAVGN